MTLLIAGHETTAAVLTWTLHCLVDHPEFMEPLQQEARLSIKLWPVQTRRACPNLLPRKAACLMPFRLALEFVASV